ncbi:MAG TPA: hypothetical protein VIY48_16955, partial [Candidatus Paceibacterota bacterium]
MPDDPNNFGPDHPTGFWLHISLDGGTTFTDMTGYTTREQSVTITRANPNEHATMSITLWEVGGALPEIPDFAQVHVVDPYMTAPLGLYIRYFNGYVLNQRPTIVANVQKEVTLECVGVDWLLDNPPARLRSTIKVGVAPVWLPGHSYNVGDHVSARPDDGHKYQCTIAGLDGTGTSAETQPIWPQGSGAHVIDNDLEWTEDGDSAVSDAQVWGELLPIFFPNDEIAWPSPLTHVLIPAVPSFEVTSEMSPRDVANKMVTLAGSRSYYATYDAWQASHSYKIGDLIEENPSVHGVIFQCIQDGVSSNLVSKPSFTSILDLGSEVADNTTRWLAYKFTGRWEASITMTVGQKVEPSPQNGRYYVVTTAGTTAATCGTWSETIGAYVNNGSVRLRCEGNTVTIPLAQLWTPSDNAGHNATWKPDFAWFDANDPTQMQDITDPQYSDQYVEDVSHYHYSEMTLNRDGGNGYANRWYVEGKNGAFAQVDDPDQQQAFGIVISRTYKDNSDTGPATYTECHDIGVALLAGSIMRETVQVTAPKVLDPVMIQKLTSCRVTASLLGLGSQKYFAQSVSVTLGNSAPQWQIELGDGFLNDRQDPYSGIRSGRKYGHDTTPPDLVTWPTGFVEANNVDPETMKATVAVRWIENSADTRFFRGYWKIVGDQRANWFSTVEYPRTHMRLVELPRSTN